MQNNKKPILKETNLEKNLEKLREDLHRIQDTNNHDYFNNTLPRNNGNGQEETLPSASTTTSSTTSSTTTTRDNITVVETVPQSSEESTIPGHRRFGVRRDLNNEEFESLQAREQRGRLLERDIREVQHFSNRQTPMDNNPPGNGYDFDRINRLADNVREDVEYRMPLRQQADIEYGIMIRGYRLLIESTRHIVFEFANFSWSHPVIATGGFIAVSGVIMMMFRGRSAVNIVRALTAGSSAIGAGGLTSLMPYNRNNQEDVIRRNMTNNTLTMVSQTAGLIYFIKLIITGLRHTR